jgi:hypothetical protein
MKTFRILAIEEDEISSLARFWDIVQKLGKVVWNAVTSVFWIFWYWVVDHKIDASWGLFCLVGIYLCVGLMRAFMAGDSRSLTPEYTPWLDWWLRFIPQKH